MANFVFYKYRFEKTDERTLFDRETGEELTESSINDKFAADLASKAESRNSLNLYDKVMLFFFILGILCSRMKSLMDSVRIPVAVRTSSKVYHSVMCV